MVSFEVSACSAAFPASLLVVLTWLGARVSRQVKSQTTFLPFAHGYNVKPSGLFPSFLDKPGGSSTEGTPQDASALF